MLFTGREVCIGKNRTRAVLETEGTSGFRKQETRRDCFQMTVSRKHDVRKKPGYDQFYTRGKAPVTNFKSVSFGLFAIWSKKKHISS